MREGSVIAHRFEILAEEGAGGMARVYRARDRATGENVALKFLRREGDAGRFEREGQILSRLDDQSIVRYIAHGLASTGEPYLVMEWLPGEDLGSRLRRGPLSVADTTIVGARVARALAVAHAHGIVHRDVKPENVFLPDGAIEHAKVLDFGIARWSLLLNTQTGAILGTPGYMAPEQARGEHLLDARADVFALGCVLYECVTGCPAFPGTVPLAVLAKILFQEVPRASASCRQVPQVLDDLIAQMMSKEAAARPADGAAVAAALAGLDPAINPSRHAAQAATPRFGSGEQRFIAVVLTRPGMAPSDEAAATLKVDEVRPPLELVRSAIEGFGATAEPLVDGSVAVVISGGGGTAIERVVQAASCALAIRGLLPAARTVLAMGRSDMTASLPVGEVIDRAARMLSETSPGSHVRVDVATAAMLEGRFAIGRGDAIELRGTLVTPETGRTLLGKPTPCVGRERELEVLASWFDECISEPRARAVVVTAPAGVGKSRLGQEFTRRLREHDHPVEIWVARGDPTRAGATFGLLAPLVRQVAGMLDGEPLEARRRKLADLVARRVAIQEREHTTIFLAELVGAPFSTEEQPRLAVARRDPKVLAEHMRRAFCCWLSAECARAPVVIVLEDLHWGDLPTVKFVELALRELRDRRLFVLALARPEVDDLFPRLWASEGALVLRLGGLPRKACRVLIDHFLGASVEAAVVERMIRQASGNAFFLEELIRAVAAGRTDTLPETVLAMATTRLEAFPADARLVMRAASIFGEVFWEGGVAAILGSQPALHVRPWLEELAMQEVLSRRTSARFADQVEYAFRHGLVREAAYAMLTDVDLQMGHRLAGEWLVAAGETEAYVLAGHFERGGDAPGACTWYVRASAQALEANDFQAVLAHAERAVGLGAADDAMRELHELRGAAFMGLGVWPQAPKELRAALALVPSADREHRASVSLKLARACFFAFEVQALREHAQAALALLEGLGRHDLEAEATALLGIYEQVAGNLAAAADAYARAKARAGRNYLPSEAQLLLTLLWLGRVDAAIERGRAFVLEARAMNDIYALMVALPQVALGLVAKGRYSDAESLFEEARETGRRHATGALVARAVAMSVGYHLDVFDFKGAEAIACQAQEMAQSFNYPPTTVSTSIDLLLAAARAGDPGRAEASLPQVEEAVRKTEGQGWHHWLFRMRLTQARAEIALAREDAQAALAYADAVIAQSQSFGRLKYTTIGGLTRGQALLALGRRAEAVATLRSALAGAGKLHDPSLVLRLALPLLEVDGDDQLLVSAQDAVENVRAQLPEPTCLAFVAAEPVGRLLRQRSGR